ncbi:MAG: hypothetical protein DRZ82_05770 [Thermoprotei archaeon]|nr:MAG: hypothetical protein DRZ82_05770 [Thermoprotei archaeon]
MRSLAYLIRVISIIVALSMAFTSFRVSLLTYEQNNLWLALCELHNVYSSIIMAKEAIFLKVEYYLSLPPAFSISFSNNSLALLYHEQVIFEKSLPFNVTIIGSHSVAYGDLIICAFMGNVTIHVK